VATPKKAARDSLRRSRALMSAEMQHFKVLSITPREVRFRYFGKEYTFKYDEGDVCLVNSPWLSYDDYAFFEWWAKAMMDGTLAGFKKEKVKKNSTPANPQLSLFSPAQLPVHSQRKK
jgi:hypothetical protein